jgi:uncharacterized membrane protein required for colicin V production
LEILHCSSSCSSVLLIRPALFFDACFSEKKQQQLHLQTSFYLHFTRNATKSNRRIKDLQHKKININERKKEKGKEGEREGVSQISS